MANETITTIRGYVGAPPTVFDNSVDKETGELIATKATVVRVGVTSRYYSRQANEFRDGPTAWYSVRTYGALADNVATSVNKGTPVMARGRLTVRQYQDKNGVMRTELVLMADSFGIELSGGRANYVKTSATPLAGVAGEPGRRWPEKTEDSESADDVQLSESDADPSDEGEPANGTAPAGKDDPAGVLTKVLP